MFNKLVLIKVNLEFAVVLRNCGQHLNDFEQREILPYSQIYFLGLESQKIQPSASPGNCNFGQSLFYPQT
jgi:hypothetical protein